MKESIGATWIFSICLTFIILFTAYLAISVNYAKAFRLKSHIVSEVEENDGFDGDLAVELDTYLTSQGYSTYNDCEPSVTVAGEATDWELQPSGCIGQRSDGKCKACIYKRIVHTGNDDIDAERAYYRAYTFFKFDLPVVNVVLPPFRIGGDSKYIYDYQE